MFIINERATSVINVRAFVLDGRLINSRNFLLPVLFSKKKRALTNLNAAYTEYYWFVSIAECIL